MLLVFLSIYCVVRVVIQKPFGTSLVVGSRPSVLELVETVETIESASQSGQLYSDLPIYAENQRVQLEGGMLEGVAAEAAAMAEAQTQPEDLPTVVDSMEAETAGMAGHNVKRMAVATSEDGGPERWTILVDDHENTVFKGKAHVGSSDDPMGQAARTELHQNNDQLQQMTILCHTVQNLGKQMQEGFAVERTRRQQDFAIET